MEKLYEMVMKFELSLGLKEIDDFMEMLGCKSDVKTFKNTVTISQAIPFIPDENYLCKVENILKDKCSDDTFNVLDCRFVGYEKFIEKERDSENNYSFDMEME